MNTDLTKFIAALAMFGAWVGLVAWGLAQAATLVNFIQLGLTGLASHLATAYVPTVKEKS